MKTIKIDPSSFKLTRPTLVMSRVSAALSPYVTDIVKRLEQLFVKKCFTADLTFDGDEADGGMAVTWPVDEMVKQLETCAGKDASLNFSDIIDQHNHTSLFYEVTGMIGSQKLPYNATKLLESEPLVKYLFCRAYYHLNLKNGTAIFKYMADDQDGGVKLLYDHIVTRSALALKKKLKFETGTDTAFGNRIYPKLKAKSISFAKDVFDKEVEAIIRNLVFDEEYYDIVVKVLDKLKIEKNEQDVAALVSYLKSSKIAIDASNAEHFIAIALNDLKNADVSFLTPGETDVTSSDFSVTYYDDEKSVLEIDLENILSAAQLYYVMVLGDELEIFNVIDRIITRHLMGGTVDIRSRQTLDALQMYAFNESFKDLKTGMVFKRTNPEERKMFYRQVFSIGSGDTMDGMVVNGDFYVLLEQLLAESAKYIAKIAQSSNPELYVSRNTIFQAMEDLQYNLSSHCTGMAKVASPIINKELDFVVERFLKNPELIRQLALSNSTSFKKVIERVVLEMRNEKPNVSALFSKAVYGHKIINTVAHYNQAFTEDDAAFSEFLGVVESFIIANNQLDGHEDASYPDMRESGQDDSPSSFIPPGVPGVGNDDWNF